MAASMSYRLETPFGELIVRDLDLAWKIRYQLQDFVAAGQTIRCSRCGPVGEEDLPAGDPAREALDAPPRLGERRRWRRHPTPGILITLEASGTPAEPWISTALDINQESLGLTLPPPLESGQEVLVTFSLDDALAFRRLPSVVQRCGVLAGAVRFRWRSSGDCQRLIRFLGAPAVGEAPA